VLVAAGFAAGAFWRDLVLALMKPFPLRRLRDVFSMLLSLKKMTQVVEKHIRITGRKVDGENCPV
jgi:hypothetical protein